MAEEDVFRDLEKQESRRERDPEPLTPNPATDVEVDTGVSALVTFFGPRDRAHASYVVCRDHFFAICTRKPLEFERDGHEDKVLADVVREIAAAVQDAEGGLIVKINTGRKLLTVSPISPKGYKAPDQILRLTADESVGYEDVGSDISYQVGDHYLIPADKAAKEKLQKLQEVLSYLPQERSILNLIREPKLERRLQMLEWELSTGGRGAGQLADQGAGGWSLASKAGFKQLFRMPAGMGWSVVTPILCTAVLVGVLWLRTGSRQVGTAKPNEIEAASRALLATMSASPRAAIEKLYRTHELSKVEAHPLKSAAFAEAVLKLEILRLKALADDSKDLDGVGKLDDTHNIESLQERLVAGGLQVYALEYLGCQNGGVHPIIANIGVPGICEGMTENPSRRVQLGFDALTEWASTTPSPPPPPPAKK